MLLESATRGHHRDFSLTLKTSVFHFFQRIIINNKTRKPLKKKIPIETLMVQSHRLKIWNSHRDTRMNKIKETIVRLPCLHKVNLKSL